LAGRRDVCEEGSRHERGSGRSIGKNEALFRLANEERERLASEADLENLTIFCECGHRWCGETIVVGPEEYQRALARPEQFFVVPGHQIEDVESVVASDRAVVP
jgi:hypothetical protein